MLRGRGRSVSDARKRAVDTRALRRKRWLRSSRAQTGVLSCKWQRQTRHFATCCLRRPTQAVRVGAKVDSAAKRRQPPKKLLSTPPRAAAQSSRHKRTTARSDAAARRTNKMCPPHAPSPRLDPPPPPSPRLAEAVTDELDRAAARAYRLQYQSYRRGSATGVIGEAPDDPRRQIALDEDEEDSGHASTSEAAEVAFNELLEWRLEYQAYRAGAAKGAKGRASGKKWPLETLRMLPGWVSAHVGRRATGSVVQVLHSRACGLWELGLGLVVPSLAKGCDKIILVQRPSAAWTLNEKVLEDGSQIACCVNNTTVLTLEVCSAPDADVAERLATSQHGLLLLSTSEEHMDAVASVATSSSVSLGPALAKGLEPLAAALRRKGSTLVCYAAENDHDAVERYAKTDVPFRLVPLLVDRVCTGRELTQREKGYVVDTAEPWRGEIVVMRGEDDVDDGGAFPSAVKGCIAPSAPRRSSYIGARY